jgi:predicted transcriptional regulator
MTEQEFLEFLAYTLSKKRISQGRAAKHAGVSRISLNRYFRGKVPIHLDTTLKLADLLDFEVILIPKE